MWWVHTIRTAVQEDRLWPQAEAEGPPEQCTRRWETLKKSRNEVPFLLEKVVANNAAEHLGLVGLFLDLVEVIQRPTEVPVCVTFRKK